MTFPLRGGVMELIIKTTSADQPVNLGYNLGRWENTNEAYNDIPHIGTVDWGDGNSTKFDGTEGIENNSNNNLYHVYSDIGEHKITISGSVKWCRMPASSDISTSNSLQNLLKKIEIPESKSSPIQCVDTSAFNYCTLLETIPSNLFVNCSVVTNFSYCFYHCYLLQSIPNKLFDNCPNVTKFSYCFAYCRNFLTIPTNLFANCNAVQSFAHCFNNCKGLQSIPDKLFDNCPNVTDFLSCFHKCTGIHTIPTNLFANCKAVTRFRACFEGCSNITGMLPELWRKYPNITERLMYKDCFSYCTKANNHSDAVAAGWADEYTSY